MCPAVESHFLNILGISVVTNFCSNKGVKVDAAAEKIMSRIFSRFRRFLCSAACRVWRALARLVADSVARPPPFGFFVRQFGILPPKVIPVARTKRTVPRKEWKELKKQQEQGGGRKGLHTMARRLAALEPFDGANDAFSPAAVSPLAVSPATVSSATLTCEAGETVAPQSNRFSAFHEWPRGLVGWAAGGLKTLDNNSPTGSSRVNPAAVGVASFGVSGEQRCREGVDAVGATPSSGEESPLRAALASHLSLLGPAACARLGFHPRGEARLDRG